MVCHRLVHVRVPLQLLKLMHFLTFISFVIIVPICQDLPEPSNGAVVYSDGTLNNRSLGVTAAYTCVLGFTLVGGGGVRSCQTDETWSGKPSTCNGERPHKCSHT